MKYVLRNLVNGRYLRKPGVWVTRPDDALSFDDSVEAREFCQAHQLTEAQPVKLLMPLLTMLLPVASSTC